MYLVGSSYVQTDTGPSDTIAHYIELDTIPVLYEYIIPCILPYTLHHILRVPYTWHVFLFVPVIIIFRRLFPYSNAEIVVCRVPCVQLFCFCFVCNIALHCNARQERNIKKKQEMRMEWIIIIIVVNCHWNEMEYNEIGSAMCSVFSMRIYAFLQNTRICSLYWYIVQ